MPPRCRAQMKAASSQTTSSAALSRRPATPMLAQLRLTCERALLPTCTARAPCATSRMTWTLAATSVPTAIQATANLTTSSFTMQAKCSAQAEPVMPAIREHVVSRLVCAHLWAVQMIECIVNELAKPSAMMTLVLQRRTLSSVVMLVQLVTQCPARIIRCMSQIHTKSCARVRNASRWTGRSAVYPLGIVQVGSALPARCTAWWPRACTVLKQFAHKLMMTCVARQEPSATHSSVARATCTSTMRRR
mmetsp:Transcript_43070/g.99115  ORF Transcript_43070/g.99115 Transcript_43070/m.99115 type:complete len:248 (-) Transcript_43070:3478-4221(-)